MKTRQLENNIIKCRKGLGVTVISLILLVISILLALVSMLYAMTIIDNAPPQELLFVHKHHIWYNSTNGGWFELGFAVTNNDGTDVFIEKVTVRGQPCTWAKTYYWKTGTVGVTEELNVTRSELPETQYVDLSSVFKYDDGNFTRASSGVMLKSGWTVVFYIKDPPATYSHHTPPTLRVHTTITSYPKEIAIDTVD